MYRVIILLVISLNSFSQNTDINSIYDKFKDERISYSKILGEFCYITSNVEKGIYKSTFVSSDTSFIKHSPINYISCNSTDTLYVANNKVLMNNFEYDPLSIKIYSLFYNNTSYVCVIGKSSSASGSGVERTSYTLFKKSNDLYIYLNSFESRFGNIRNIIDINNDGELDYIKIYREGKYYKLSFYDFRGNSLERGHLLLDYKLDNKFDIICNNLKGFKLK